MGDVLFDRALAFVVEFGLGARVKLLDQFLKRGDKIELAKELGVTPTFVSQIVNQNEKRYTSRRVEVAVYKLARENAKKDPVLLDAWHALFGDKA